MCSRRKQPDLEDLIVQHMNFGKKRRGLNRTIFFALALAGEAGELCNIIKKKLRGDRKYKGKAGAALFAKQVDGETVDLGNYVYMMAAHREIPLTKAMLQKLIEVEQRDDDWNKNPLLKVGPPQHVDCRMRCTDALPGTRRKKSESTERWAARMDRRFSLAGEAAKQLKHKGGTRGRHKNRR